MELVQVLRRGLQQVSGHGGLRGYLRVLFRANDVRVGTLVGEDKYGNKYYEDNKQFFGRHRWVIYTTEMNGRDTFWDVDGSMVPPEWAAPAADGGSEARGQIRAVAAGLCQSRIHARSSRICDPHHSSQQRWILNPLSEARDGTRNSFPLRHAGSSKPQSSLTWTSTTAAQLLGLHSYHTLVFPVH
uniref:NADH dehydrogenase [ubiquinone] 1 alpha subcomplex subunit 12 n=1 Tax=Sus scrofa TaxID=9823 RepID=A0A8D1CP28_PIG